MSISVRGDVHAPVTTNCPSPGCTRCVGERSSLGDAAVGERSSRVTRPGHVVVAVRPGPGRWWGGWGASGCLVAAPVPVVPRAYPRGRPQPAGRTIEAGNNVVGIHQDVLGTIVEQVGQEFDVRT